MAAVNLVPIPFEGSINPGDPTGIKLYFQANKEIDEGIGKLDILVSNSK